MANEQQVCVSALKKLQSDTGKYPDIIAFFNEWYEENDWLNAGLDEELYNCPNPMEDSSFVEEILDTNIAKNEEEARQIFDALNHALTRAFAPNSQTNKAKPLNGLTITKLANSDDDSDNDNDDDKKEDDSPPPTLPVFDKRSSLPVRILSHGYSKESYKKYVKNPKSPLRERLQEQAEDLLTSDAKGCKDILTAEFLGFEFPHHEGTYPLLNHFVDAYNRCKVNEWIENGRKESKIVNPSQFFREYCKHPKFKAYFKKNKDKDFAFVQTMIHCYNSRLVPHYNCTDQHFKIKENAPERAIKFVEYLFDAVEGIQTKLKPVHEDQKHLIPTQLDLLIISDQFEETQIKSGDDGFFDSEDETDDDEDYSDDDDDDDDEEEEEKNGGGNDSKVDLGDIRVLLENRGIKVEVHDRADRPLKRLIGLEKVIGQKQCQRAVLVVDRRNLDANDNDKKTHPQSRAVDPLYMFQPPGPHGSFEKVKDLCTPSLHQNCIKAMLPKKDKGFHGVRDHLGGQMCVFSFHVMSVDEIRCYMFYNGQCLRFYPNDIFNIIPELFVDSKGVREKMIHLMENENAWRRRFELFSETLQDKLFDEFYHGLVDKSPHIPVPEMMQIVN